MKCQVNQKMTKKVLLKEYGAEIESLRVMLQLTREKNGVYLDPAQFEQMEARLQSQESQLLECESALKSKLDEVKQLRAEREEIEEALREAQASLDEKTQRLDTAVRDLEQTNEKLCVAETELEATEAVVGEQMVTEVDLTSTGSGFMEIILSHRGDIDLLHDKVKRHNDMEIQRVVQADSFQSEVIQLQNALVHDVAAMKDKTSCSTTEMCENVDALLTRGKETCSSLQRAIDGALGTLTSDADAARGNMIQSCASLEADLQGMGQATRTHLSGLKADLGDWISDLDSGLSSVLGHLNSQQDQVHIIITS
jgi:kinesin family protein 11